MVLAPSLHGFVAHSGVKNVRLESTNEPSELQRLAPHVLIRHDVEGAAPLDAVGLANDCVLPVCASSLMAAGSWPLRDPEELENHVLLRYETVVDGRSKIDWFRWLQAMGLMRLRPRGVVSFGLYNQVICDAVAGCGVAIGRLPLVARHLQEGRLVAPFAESGVQTGAWYAILSHEPRLVDQQRAFLVWLKSVLQA